MPLQVCEPASVSFIIRRVCQSTRIYARAGMLILFAVTPYQLGIAADSTAPAVPSATPPTVSPADARSIDSPKQVTKRMVKGVSNTTTPEESERLVEPAGVADLRLLLGPIIEDALDYGRRPIDERQQLIQRGYSLLSQNDPTKNDATWVSERAGLDLAFGYLHYELGDIGLATKTLERSLAKLSKDDEPELYVRSTALLAGLLSASGREDRGLAMLEELLAADLPLEQAHRVEYARVNYAFALLEVGRSKEASKAYEQVLLYAESANDDVLTLAAGSNYVSLLKNQGLSAEAEYWLYQLKPAMSRLPGSQGTAELELFEFCLMLNAGKIEAVLAQLESFMARPQKRPDAILSQSQVIYSDALRAVGRYEESLTATGRALQLTAELPTEQIDARIAKVRTLLAMQDYLRAGDELESLNAMDSSEPSVVTTLHQLQLEYALRIGNTRRAELAFDRYKLTSASLNEFINGRQADYYGEKLRTQRTELELKLARDAQALFAAEAMAQSAQTSELRIRERANRERRNIQIGSITIIALAAIGLVILNSRRRLQKRLQEELSARNETLSALVDAKSRDLVDQVTEQAALKQALAERRHMEAIGQIAGHVAHDFNNTLQVVSSANELLEPLVSTDVHRRVLGASNRSIHTGSSTVRQLLSYSRNQQLESTVFSIERYFDGNAALFRSAIGEVNTLRIENRLQGARVNLDSGQLTSSLINLLRNSADAMDRPGEIILRCLSGANFVGDNSLPQVVAQVKLQVVDEGRGMSAEQAKHAFEPYYTTKTIETGTGLGLSSVYGFVVQSGGSVTIDSEVGKGTTVSLSFPSYEGAVAEEPVSAKVESVLANARVLLVEDNVLIAETLQEMLIREGAETAWVDSADAAQAKLESEAPFDIMLSDINIRGALNGFDLARWVRAFHPGMQIGMMSGYGPTMNEEFDVPVLAKPFTRQQLLSYLIDKVWSLKA